MKRWRLLQVTVLASIFSLASIGLVQADYSSPNYKVDQVFFGSGGTLDTSSPNYQAKAALGEIGVGNTKSNDYQAQAGFNTTDQPYLQFIVNGSNIDLGVLSSATTATATGTFSVKNYLSDGYVVQTDSPPPSSNGHTLQALTSATASDTSTEQFGMNLVANACPPNSITSGPGSCSGGLGANLVQVPNSSFSHGSVTAGAPGPNGTSVATGYDTANEFKYVNGDIIAASNQSSGETDYTISYIFNISNTTPAGQYSFNDVLIATATY